MASLVPNNPYDVTQQKQFAGTGDVTGYITGGAKNGDNWDFMDQQGKILTSVPYTDFVNKYQTDAGGAVRSGVTSVNGVPVYDFGAPRTYEQSANNGIIGGAQASATPSAPAAAPTPNVTTAPSTSSLPSITPTAPVAPNVATYTPATRSVNQANETVQGQVNSILSQDSPLMQRARTLATQQMAQRGLVNSSMAQGAGVAAMIDRATPIAQQDAQTFGAASSDNMAARNRAAEFNSGALNTAGLQKSEQGFQGEQLQRQQQFTAQQTKAQQDFTAAQSALDRAQQAFLTDKTAANQMALQTAQQNFAASQAQLDRAQQANLQTSQQEFQKSLTGLQQSFTAAQAGLDRAQQFALQNDAQDFQKSLNSTNIPANFAIQINQSTMAAVNAIAADANLSGTVDGKEPAGSSPKSRAIQSAINYANSQIQWANKFYSTNIPTMTTA